MKKLIRRAGKKNKNSLLRPELCATLFFVVDKTGAHPTLKDICVFRFFPRKSRFFSSLGAPVAMWSIRYHHRQLRFSMALLFSSLQTFLSFFLFYKRIEKNNK
jgi:uncharacterized membrane protein YsdA (DUF1294 family)